MIEDRRGPIGISPTHDEISDLIARELPGVQFEVTDDGSTMQMMFLVKRVVEGYRYIIPALAEYEPGVLGQAARSVIDGVRRKATDDYGLTPYIERLKREAADEARAELMDALARYVERFREKIPTIVSVEDEGMPGTFYDEASFAWGDLPPEVAQIVAWSVRQKTRREDDGR